MAEHCEYSKRHSESSKSNKHNIHAPHSLHQSAQARRHSKYNDDDIKTPPLPSGKNLSIEVLMKTRESLKNELRKIKTSDKYTKRHKENDTTKHKPLYDDNQEPRRKRAKETTPEVREPVDSEDEENIIEQRRIQRKQLLAKLTSGCEKQPNTNNVNIFKKTQAKVSLFQDELTEQVKLDSETEEPRTKNETKDMFSERDEFDVPNSASDRLKHDTTSDNPELCDNWDDEEGYYKIRIGNVLNNRYTVKNLVGQGMFANVVHAIDKHMANTEVAIKIARNKDLMYKNGLKEITMLKEINNADPESRHHCVKYLRHFMHKNHLCIVLESLNMDLRSILKKYGKNCGLNMTALMSYSRQLLLALRILKKVGIVHADIKPDNILVNENKNLLKLCDFGSAEKVDDNEVKPYLVSRFYRAPEIILGMTYGHAIDLWSSACTIYEIATGRIMFTGNSNNKMLKCFMDVKGKFPNRMLKKGKFKDQHFNYNNNFLLHKKNPITNREKLYELCNITVTRNLYDELKKACKNPNSKEERKLGQLKDILDKMLMLDPTQRLSVTDCLRHPFLQEFEK